MLRKFFATVLVLFIIGGCVGTMRMVDAPSKIKGATMQTKVDNNSTKK